MKSLLSSVVTATSLLLIAVPAFAQAPGIDLRVNPRIGVYAPLSDRGEVVVGGVTIAAEQSGGLALGLGVELDMLLLPVNLRANLDYATGAEVRNTRDGVTVGDPVETTLLAVVGDLVFRPLPKVILAQPYLFVGGGLKQYGVDEETTTTSFRDESDPTLHIGGGLELGFGPLALNAELGDYISWYQLEGADDSEMQHDLFVTVGVVMGIL